MRVLHIASSIDPKHGGPPVALLGLTTAQARLGLRVSVVNTFRPHSDNRLADKMREAGVNIRLIGPTRSALALHPEIKPALADAVAQADVIHIHGLWEQVQYVAAKSAYHQNKPYIMRPAGMLDTWSLGQKQLKKRLYMALRLKGVLLKAAAVHFTAQAEYDNSVSWIPPSQVIIEPNGISLDEFDNLPSTDVFRQTFPEVGDRPYVLFMSRLHHKKGLEVLLPAFAEVKTDAVLVVAGSGDAAYLQSLKDLTQSLGLSDRVVFTGLIQGECKLSALANAELMALCSYQENFGIVVVEALAAGTPVVISDKVNIHHEVTRAGVGGVVPIDPQSLRAELDRWLSDQPMRVEAGYKAARFARQTYNWDPIAQRWAQHYQRIIGARSGATSG